MRYYISFTGKSAESHDALITNVEAVSDALNLRGHETDSSLSRAEPEAILGVPLSENDTFAECMKVEFSALDTANALFFLVQSPLIGTGQAMELSYARARRLPVVIASHESAKETFLDPLADYKFTYQNAVDLGNSVLAMTDRPYWFTP